MIIVMAVQTRNALIYSAQTSESSQTYFLKRTMRTLAQSRVFPYGLFVPRPFCMEGPYDWLYVEGPVVFEQQAAVTADGRYACSGGYRGALVATPEDISTGEPLGPSFTAKVAGRQSGRHGADGNRVASTDRRMTLEDVGPQVFRTQGFQ